MALLSSLSAVCLGFVHKICEYHLETTNTTYPTMMTVAVVVGGGGAAAAAGENDCYCT